MSADLIRVPVAGGGELVVRPPALLALVAQRWLPIPLLARAHELIGADDGERPQWVHITADEEQAQEDDTLDRWVAFCAVAPRIVLDQREAGAEVLHVAEVPYATKRAIFHATYTPLLHRMQDGSTRLARFLEQQDLALFVDRTARQYSTRPSALLEIDDAAVAFDFDLAIATVAHAYETELLEQRRESRH